MIGRREMLAAAGALIAAGAAASPVLVADNHGLTLPRAARRNGWVEVDAAAFATNIDTVRGLIGTARLCAVLKADAYGNGIALLIRSIIAKRVEDVAITSNDEARVARQLGYRGRLLRIRTATPDEMEDGFALKIEESIGNADAAARLAMLWQRRNGRRALRVHLALNSGGMSRNGVELRSDYGKADARAILALSGLQICGVMTHYPSENAPDILAQLAQYTDDLAWLRGAGLAGPVTRHTANSFATLQHPETRTDMVRVGGLLYGDPGSVRSDAFAPTMAIKSRVAAVNHYPAGQTVSYDRTFRLARESWLANIPLGYSDGFRRSFSRANEPAFATDAGRNPQALIGGRRFAIVGRVTMNTLMVDVTGQQAAVGLGDEVVMFGAQGDDRITQAEFEAAGNGYGPELLGMLGAGLPRVPKTQGRVGAGRL